MPPSGDNQHSVVTQYIGPVAVTIDYRSPNVHGPNGEDRTGKVWGALVPFGMANLGFGTCGDDCPWRGGANENTVLAVSHDVEIEGQRLPAGRYGVHFIPGPEAWTLILSRNSTSWGSFFYDAKEDQMRVPLKPAKAAYTEFLTYEFTDRQPDRASGPEVGAPGGAVDDSGARRHEPVGRGHAARDAQRAGILVGAPAGGGAVLPAEQGEPRRGARVGAAGRQSAGRRPGELRDAVDGRAVARGHGQDERGRAAAGAGAQPPDGDRDHTAPVLAASCSRRSVPTTR